MKKDSIINDRKLSRNKSFQSKAFFHSCCVWVFDIVVFSVTYFLESDSAVSDLYGHRVDAGGTPQHGHTAPVQRCLIIDEEDFATTAVKLVKMSFFEAARNVLEVHRSELNLDLGDQLIRCR